MIQIRTSTIYNGKLDDELGAETIKSAIDQRVTIAKMRIEPLRYEINSQPNNAKVIIDISEENLVNFDIKVENVPDDLLRRIREALKE